MPNNILLKEMSLEKCTNKNTRFVIFAQKDFSFCKFCIKLISVVLFIVDKSAMQRRGYDFQPDITEDY